MKKLQQVFLTGLLALAVSAAADAPASIERLTLNNKAIAVELTPDIGGRLLSIALTGKPNFLVLGEAVLNNPHPEVGPQSDNVGYLGHEIWVGPQSEWWSHQTVNSKRADAKADWPPDPYLILPKNKLLASSESKVEMQGPESPVSGVQITKTYALMSRPNSLRLEVTAQNIRTDAVAWDIWFNTRVRANTQVYVPVVGEDDVRVKNIEDDINGPLAPRIQDGFFTLEMSPPADGKKRRKGKVFIQPSQGWMAGFHGDQVLIITFPLLPRAVIHSDQGQIELYNEFNPQLADDGLLEMELHTAYTKLAPKQKMQAYETWTILEYTGPATAEAQRAFLRKHTKELQLH